MLRLVRGTRYPPPVEVRDIGHRVIYTWLQYM